jgi:hypothetical protein
MTMALDIARWLWAKSGHSAKVRQATRDQNRIEARTCNWRRTGISPVPRFERPIWDSAPCFSLIAKAFSLAWNKIRLPAFGHR